MTVDDLQTLIELLDWDDFQRIQEGQIHVHVPYVRKGSENLIRFAYRVGLHIKQPMEAIMAQGNYIRMQAAPQYAACHLERLDPENVDQCLYNTYYHATNTYTRGWRPQLPVQIPPQYLQAASQTVMGSGGGGTSSAYYPASNISGLHNAAAALQSLGNLLGKA